jgi:CysZ protein
LLKEIIIAIESYGKAHRFISKHKLWRWIIVPGILYALLFGISMYFFGSTASSFTATLTNSLKSWLEKSNLGWLNFLVSFFGIVLWVLTVMFYFSLFKFVWLILGSPLFAYLSEKTEALIEGKDFPFSLKQLLSDIIRGIRLALRNSLWQTVYTVAIIILSFIPVVGWATPVLSVFIECYYYGFSMLDYSCERHKLSASQSIQFIGGHKGLAIGNGMVFYIMHLLPVIGWVLAPSYAVVAATISLYHQKDNY